MYKPRSILNHYYVDSLQIKNWSRTCQPVDNQNSVIVSKGLTVAIASGHLDNVNS